MSDDAADTDAYALKSDAMIEIDAPKLHYLPPRPKSYQPRIGMIGTGGISNSHLDAYRTAGWEVSAMWNRTLEKAERKAAEFFPKARVMNSIQALLDDRTIDVVDITLPTEHRAGVIRQALEAGKHVLSQKPFVSDLGQGHKLVSLAEDRGLCLAVNQNGRWSPHMSWMRNAVYGGFIGDVLAAHTSIHWDHSWTAGTPFDEVEDLILYDFGIHWFDFMASLIGDRAQSVFATATRAKDQRNKVPLFAQAMIQMDGGQASLIFDGGALHGPRDTTFIAGSEGSLQSDGPDLGNQVVKLVTASGFAYPKLQGKWFNDGFLGAMGELLCAIEDGKIPLNSARENLKSLALTFAAIQSCRIGKEIRVGTVQSLP